MDSNIEILGIFNCPDSFFSSLDSEHSSPIHAFARLSHGEKRNLKYPKSEMRGRKIMELSGKVEYCSNVHALAHNWKTLHSESKISYINFVGIICIFSSCLIGFFFRASLAVRNIPFAVFFFLHS